ncbi:MAG TPA: amidohydrolase family protein [Planctomycetota bacterium]|nr:amidohydrolase family protein [Planctomycetota bacterium]
MIVDVHTHVWRYPDHIDESFMDGLRAARPGVKIDITVDFEPFMEAMKPCDRVVCFGLRGLKTGLHVPNDHIAGFVARAPEKLIGFMSLDPNEPGWMDDFERSRTVLKLRGVKLGPIYAGFDPTEPRLDPLYAACARHDLPVLIHVGTSFVRFGPLEWSRPILIDSIARRHPELRIIMAHLGHPWEGEAIAVARKHPHVYADVSALHYRPWQFYHSLMLAQEYGAIRKLLFGSDYPFTDPTASMEGLRDVNRFCAGTALPRVGEAAIEELIHRDTLRLLWGAPP